MPLLQGRCVGGSTLVNSAIAWRIPEDVVDDWAARFGLGATSRCARSSRTSTRSSAICRYARSIRRCSARTTASSSSRREKHGFEAAPMRRYDRGCKGSGLLPHGLPQRRQAGDERHLRAVGARSAARASSRRAPSSASRSPVARAVARARAVGERASRHASTHGAPSSSPRAPCSRRTSCVAAASARAALGRHFQAHPGLAIGGLFPSRADPIQMAFGATQGAESTHFRASDRFKLETISLPPDLAGARIPGVGLRALGATRAARARRGVGRAGPRRGRGRGHVGLGRRRPRALHDDEERPRSRAKGLRAHRAHALRGRRARGLAGHLRQCRACCDRSTRCATSRARRSIRAATTSSRRTSSAPRAWATIRARPWSMLDFQVHGVDGLHVVDSSVFPTNLGVNPQHSIMAMSRLAADAHRERANLRARARAKPLDEAVTAA